MKKLKWLFSVVLITLYVTTYGQEIGEKKEENKDPLAVLGKGLKLKLNDSGSSYLSFGMGMNFWFRSMEMNPGTIDKNTGEAIDHYSDFEMRRLRASMMANFDNKLIFYTQFGNTSYPTYGTNGKGMHFHSLWGKYKIAKDMYIGAGLHMWNGLSRLSNVSYASIMTLDNPGFNFPNVNVGDQVVRQVGVFWQGKAGRLEYQFAVNQPFLESGSSKIYTKDELLELVESNPENYGVAQNTYHNNFSYKGYVSYNFFYNEKVATTPYKAMSYFGNKGLILNLGAGFQYVNDASAIVSEESPNDVSFHSQSAVAADVLFETPLPHESALTVYSAFYHYDYGDNYLWKTTVMGGFAANDPNSDVVPAQGGGIQQYTFGTGNVFYLNAGYVIPNTNKKLMPFAAATYKDLEGLNEASWQGDLGMHYLIHGNNLKVTGQYSTRPIYNSESLTIDDHKGMFILQLQVKI
ncbi:hypothetical protein [Sediminitomix flava]|uniref:Short chain amide porin n=1 Tax=Sediminitomix flava TaxID=379075 RepID=A0A315ZES7_SEDFL|nr:hypothetical protein [Sediminitomix flava]PWJ43659.1 hypothetical protein BC781_1015 [Sediminitomix flava]